MQALPTHCTLNNILYSAHTHCTLNNIIYTVHTHYALNNVLCTAHTHCTLNNILYNGKTLHTEFCNVQGPYTEHIKGNRGFAMGKKAVSVLAHTFLLPQRANSGYILSMSPLRYSRS